METGGSVRTWGGAVAAVTDSPPSTFVSMCMAVCRTNKHMVIMSTRQPFIYILSFWNIIDIKWIDDIESIKWINGIEKLMLLKFDIYVYIYIEYRDNTNYWYQTFAILPILRYIEYRMFLR